MEISLQKEVNHSVHAEIINKQITVIELIS